MSKRQAYTATEASAMIADYQSGMTMREVGEKWFCSWSTVQNYLNRYGCPARPKSHNARRNRHMIKNDWNAGYTVERIMQTHRFPTENAVHQYVRRWRHEGFVWRKHTEKGIDLEGT